MVKRFFIKTIFALFLICITSNVYAKSFSTAVLLKFDDNTVYKELNTDEIIDKLLLDKLLEVETLYIYERTITSDSLDIEKDLVGNKDVDNGVFVNAGSAGSGITLTIGNTVTRIPNRLFYPLQATGSEPNIKTLTFAETTVLDSIGSAAFANVSALDGHVNIPNCVKTIETTAFSMCTGIDTLTIGTGVEIIGDYAFHGTFGLTAINYNAIIVTDKDRRN